MTVLAGEVGAVFAIENRASATLKRLMDEFYALQVSIEKVQTSMRSLSTSPGGMTALESQMTKIAQAAATVGDETAAAFIKIDASADKAAVSMARVADAMKGISAEAKAVGGSSVVLGAAGGGRGRGGMFHVRGPGASLPGGSHITASGGDGFWGWIAAAAAAVGVKDIFQAGGDLETQKKLLADKLGNRGSQSDIDGAVAAALRYATDSTTGVIGTTPAENLKGIRELMSVTPTLTDAEALYGPMMRVSKALEELSGGKKKADETMPILAKALENLGGGIDPVTHQLDPARMQRATDEALKTIIAGGGFIDAQALFGLAKQAGGMGRLSEPGKLFDEVITSLIDMGGPRTGTALSATGRQFLGDKMTVQTAQELTDLGLLPEGGWRKAGGTGITMNPGVDIKGVDQIKSGDITGWFVNTVAPAIEAKFGSGMSTADLIQESSKMFGQQTGQRLALMFLANEAQRQRDVAIKNGVDPSGVYQGMIDKDFGANVGNLGSAIVGFAQIVGAANIPAAIMGLQLITNAVHGLTNLAAQIPTAAQIADNPVAHFNEAAGAAIWNAIQKFDNAIHGKAFGGGAQAAPVTNTSNVKVDVFVDSELVASKIMSQIEAALRLPGSSAGFDGSANHSSPDSYNF